MRDVPQVTRPVGGGQFSRVVGLRPALRGLCQCGVRRVGQRGWGGLGAHLRLQLQTGPSPRGVLRGTRVFGYEPWFTSMGKWAES